VTLHYELPVGLVGGDLPITIGGGISSGTTTVHLTSTVGVGSCTASGTKITCAETFGDLGALPINMTIVQQTASQDPTVTVASRVAVANIFSSDPIGTVDFDLNAPADDHHGGGGGGGGKGRH
jgi:hypothetical protein